MARDLDFMCSSTNHLTVLKSNISTISFAKTVRTIGHWASACESRYVCIANVHMLVEAHRDSAFAEILQRSDLVTPDGMPLVVALKLLHGIRQERIAGMDLLPALIADAASRSIPVYFYGSTKVILERIVARVRSEYPALCIAGAFAPPFRMLTFEEDLVEIERINKSGAGIVFVALGCPKQERWMADHKGKVTAVMVGVGGAFPVYAGVQSRAPMWMRSYSLEWLYRLIKEPRRLFVRYLYTNTVFLILIFQQLLKLFKERES